MKGQYVGDINDYRKYGLLRALLGSGDLSLLVAWLLTPNDGRTDGARRAYLRQPASWQHFDPPLFDLLSSALANDTTPSVAMIERSSMLPRTRFFSEIVPDHREARALWADRLLGAARSSDLVFLDPDNGFEIASKPVGRKDSSKYATWSEVQRLWDVGSSLLVLQNYKREKKDVTISRLAAEMQERTRPSFVEVLDTPDVFYVLAAQPQHSDVLQRAMAAHLPRWHGQTRVVRLAKAEGHDDR